MKGLGRFSALIRIGIDAGMACSHRPTGVEYYAREVTRALVSRTWPDVSLYLYLPPYPPEEFIQTRGAVSKIRPWQSTRWRSLWLTARSWLDRLDVFFTFGSSFPRWSKGRKMLTIYDTIFCEFPESYAPGVAQNQFQTYQARLKHVHGIAVCSQTTADNVKKFFRCEAPATVLGGAPRSCFVPAPSSELRQVLTGLTPPYFLFVGRLDKRKNPAQVVRAYRLLLARGFSSSLVLVGPPDSGSAELEHALAEPTVAGENILVPGYLPEEDLVALYQGATAFIYPSLAEGYGLPVLEAAACGTPVIASAIPAVKEIAQDFSLLIDPQNPEAMAEAMARLLSDQALRASMRASGLQAVKETSWDRCANHFIQGATSLAKGSRHS